MKATSTGRRFPLVMLAMFALAATTSVAAERPRDPWPYLPSDDIGAVDWRAAHPTWDGRGVVIAILDTGVDGYAPGLTATTTGGQKLLDTRDFTDEGVWEVVAVELEDDAFVHPDGMRLEGAAALAVAPPSDDKAYPVWMGVLDEPRFRNVDDLQDANDDGDRTDRFAFLVYAAPRAAVEAALGAGRGLDLLAGLNETAAATVAAEREGARVWLVVVDTDGDGRLDDERPLRDFRVDWDLFGLRGPDAPDSRTLMAWSVNVTANEDWLGAPEAPTVSFHHDSGSHGSHCAGIAAGCEVGGQPGLHGAAPGAWLISCKIGDNRLSGGATRTETMKKAFEHAVDFGERYGLPVVVNMSFGINAVEEGDDAIGKWLDDLLAEHPEFTVCTSNGNEGPGLSTSGIPATSRSLIASGAYLSRASGEDLYQARLPRPTLFAFSSRGGETPKPDVVAPGSALSTVPGFVDGSARFNGTSMASPQTAGAVACLLSAAGQEGLEVHWGMLKRALIAGAKPVPGLALFEQGGGLVNIQGAWDVLRPLALSRSAHQVLGWAVSVDCPFQSDGKSSAAYWRTPGGAPVSPERVTFSVKPVFHPDLGPDEKDAFFRSFSFRSEAPWLQVISQKRYVRGDAAMEVDVAYDARQLPVEGVVSARVIAALDGGDLSGPAAREFDLWNTVVSGVAVGPQDGFATTFTGKGLQASTNRRHYVQPPAGATAMRCRLEVSRQLGAVKGAGAALEICDPEGAVRGGWAGYARPESSPVVDTTILPPELRPGIWELNVTAAIGNLADTDYRLTVSFDGYEADPPTLAALVSEGTGEPAEAELTVTRSFPGVFKGTARAQLDGFRREREVEVEKADTWTHDFALDATTPRAEFHLTMDEATANLLTDCAVNILDAEGTAVSAGAFTGLQADASVALPAGAAGGKYTLQVVAAFALKKDSEEWGFTAEERYLFAAPSAGKVEAAGGAPLRLYCGVPAALSLSFEGGWPAPPQDLHPYGAVRFLDANLDDRAPGDREGRLVLEVPIRLED